MQFKTLARPSQIHLQIPSLRRFSPPPFCFNRCLKAHSHTSLSLQNSRISSVMNRGSRFAIGCISSSEVVGDGVEFVAGNEENVGSISLLEEEEVEVEVVGVGKQEFGVNQSIWGQMKEIMMFTGPATGLWICGPLMSLIDTAVIGQGSSVELAALGPGTVVCDYMSYVFMFLSIATSNMVATSLARQDKKEVQHQISTLLFVGFTCGVLMLLFTKFLGAWALTVFTGPKNAHIVPAANVYVQIRGLAWPAVLVGWVAQSASLGMKDSWGPLKALAVASAINGIGDIVLCSFLGYGIAGAAWATMVSQVIAGYMMIEALNKKGYNAFAFSVPSLDEFVRILGLAAPVFVTMMSKARMLLKSLLIMGALVGLTLGTIAIAIPWLFPHIFTHDGEVIQEMHKVLIPYFLALVVTPSTHSLEGTLLAGRELRFISLSMSGCFSLGGLLLLFVYSRGYGLSGCWFGLAAFQWARFFLALQRLFSPNGILYSEDLNQSELGKLKAV